MKPVVASFAKVFIFFQQRIPSGWRNSHNLSIGDLGA
jgi:hypothetical protein